MSRKILGLDASSSTIGWALLTEDTLELLETGHIKPPTKKQSKDNFSLRLDFIFNHITDLIKMLKPDVVVIEDYARKFSKKLSTANTIIVLASVNEVVGLASYRLLDKQPTRITVARIRSVVEKEFKTSLPDKESILPFIRNKYDNFEIIYKKTGTIKDEKYDEADAVMVALGYILDEEINKSQKN